MKRIDLPAIMELKTLSGLMLVAIGLTLGGCATPTGSTSALDVEDRSNLIVVRSGNEIEMSWNSQADRSYTILHSSRRDAAGNQWKPLRGYVNIRGTGRTIRATDRVPRGKKRYYRLRSTEL